MSNLSIFEKRWIDLVFEGRNKKYGAYQLRQENPKTTLIAFFSGLFVVTALCGIPILLSSFKAPEVKPPVIDRPIIIHKVELAKPVMPKVTPPARQQPRTTEPQTQLINPIVVQAPLATPTPIVTTPVNPEPPTTPGTGTTPITDPTPSGPGIVTTPAVTPNPNAILRPGALDKLPEFPGGIERFHQHITNNFERLERDTKISVLLSFVIEKDGSMTDIRVLQSTDEGASKAAIEVLKSLRTKWKPGLKDGQPVRTLFRQPITVQP